MDKDANNAEDILRKFKGLRSEKGIPTKDLQCNRTREQGLLKLLIALDDPSRSNEIISNYRRDIWETLGTDRFSPESKEAYAKLKRVLKYHLFSLVSSLLDANGNLIEDEELVNQELLKTLQETQVSEEYEWIEKKDFPILPRLNDEDFCQILDSLSNGKALAYDGVTDALFRKPRSPRTEKERRNPPICLYEATRVKLRNIWRTNLDHFLDENDTWGIE